MSFISRGVLHRHLDLPPTQDPNVMTATRAELQKTHSVQPPKEKTTREKQGYPISGVEFLTKPYFYLVYWAHLVGSFTFFYFHHWTFRFLFGLPKALVAELDILRPGNFRNSRSFGVGDETRSRLVQCTTADPATVEPKNTTLRRPARSNRWKGNLVEIQ